MQGQEHRHAADQVRGGAAHEEVALARALVGDGDIAGGEVAQAAVDELGTPAAGAEGEVVPVDEEDGQPSGGGIQSRPGAGDSGTDDQQIDGGTFGDRLQIP
ncbi:hypothetical protein GCM10012280_34750 [Wenjunlia tyrosinilytica]|uniref:Uncharacterized protein n=1 Tax=Wenjunlia tyrosinilytica TaxID=1544741 RepID=A0A917ZS92_9ACTN|nr:hypothetical protein GCM10012280_34750 [Wenjunlia tyrosinilytica]